MKLTSVTGKNWILRKFDNNDVKKFSEKYSLKEIKICKFLNGLKPIFFWKI